MIALFVGLFSKDLFANEISAVTLVIIILKSQGMIAVCPARIRCTIRFKIYASLACPRIDA